VQPSGRKSWAVRYRFAGKPRKLTLDGALTLAAARKAAAEALHELAQGRDPAAAKSAVRTAAAALAADTVDKWAAQFIERHAKKRTRENSWRQTVHVLDDIVLPVWGGRTVHNIKRRDVIDLVESVAEDRPVMANRTLAVLSKFFSWMCERDIVAASPCTGVKRPSEEQARDRILTDDEIRRLWLSCDAVGGRFGPLVKLLLLTGQRRGEVTGMRRSKIIGDVWTLDPEETKNKQRHDVPLSKQAAEIIEAMPRISGDYVLTSATARRIGGLAKSKRALDAHMRPASRWTLHDLRRTAASGMAKLGVKLPVIERVLNHTSGSFSGVVGIYNRHDFAAEKRDALQSWADHVDSIVRGEPVGKVVKLRGRS
jgi:integrase